MTADDHCRQNAASLAVVQAMEDALGRSETDMTQYFYKAFVWRGNRGCGTKYGVEGFVRDWQRPFRASFGDRVYHTEKLIADGPWAACFGHCETTHHSTFMGVAATGKRIRIPYMDFWRVEDGRIAYNPVFVDFASVLFQLGRDIFEGEGLEAYDRDEKVAPVPAE